MRLAVLAPVPLVAVAALLTAACGSTSSPAAAAGAGSSASSSAPAPPQAQGSAVSAAAGSSAAAHGGAGSGTSCPAAAKATMQPTWLSGLEFVSDRQGWAVGQNVILHTSDGGAHWRPQLSGQLNLTSVDFVNATDGWAVGTTSLLATTDGGGHWTALTEPCPVIRSVHFSSPSDGYAVAGGRNVGDGAANGDVPADGGVLLATGNGGRTWHKVAAPPSIQSACFTDARHGWLGAAGLLYRTANGGSSWTSVTAKTWSADSTSAEMNVECAAGGTAWALSTGPEAGMSQESHIGYHASQSGATALFAEQYFPHPGVGTTAQAPGPYPGPFSALGPSSAVYVDWCDACGSGTAPWDLVTAHGSGFALHKQGQVGQLTEANAASFLSAQAGWVAGTDMENASGKSRQQQRIVATSDGGRTWQTQWAGPWSAWSG